MRTSTRSREISWRSAFLESLSSASARKSNLRLGPTFQKFQQNPAHPSLQLERLRSDPRFWSVRVTRAFRAVAQRFEGDLWVWVWIGSHKDFDRQFPA